MRFTVISKVCRAIAFPLKWLCCLALKRLRYFVIYRTGSAIGDQLCMTSIVRAVYEQWEERSIVISSYPELFDNNPYVAKNIAFPKIPRILHTPIKAFLWLFRGGQIECCRFEPTLADKPSHKVFYHASLPHSLAQIHSLHFIKKLSLENFTPEIFLTKDECEKYNAQFKLQKDYAIIHSQGKISMTPNKAWPATNFATIVKLLPELTWIQVGLPNDTPIPNTLDYRGKTDSIRALAYIISQANIIVCLEGLYNHIGAAFGVPSVVIASGLLNPAIYTYPTTRVITYKVECSPCGLIVGCPIPGQPCINNVQPITVVQEIKKIIKNSL